MSTELLSCPFCEANADRADSLADLCRDMRAALVDAVCFYKSAKEVVISEYSCDMDSDLAALDVKADKMSRQFDERLRDLGVIP